MLRPLKVNNHAFIWRSSVEGKKSVDSRFILRVAFSRLFGCLVGKFILIAVINRAIPCRIFFSVINSFISFFTNRNSPLCLRNSSNAKPYALGFPQLRFAKHSAKFDCQLNRRCLKTLSFLIPCNHSRILIIIFSILSP